MIAGWLAAVSVHALVAVDANPIVTSGAPSTAQVGGGGSTGPGHAMSATPAQEASARREAWRQDDGIEGVAS